MWWIISCVLIHLRQLYCVVAEVMCVCGAVSPVGYPKNGCHEKFVPKLTFCVNGFYMVLVPYKLFCALLSSNCIYDSCMMSIFTREAVQKVYAEFHI